jgi:hypothetical protein
MSIQADRLIESGINNNKNSRFSDSHLEAVRRMNQQFGLNISPDEICEKYNFMGRSYAYFYDLSKVSKYGGYIVAYLWQASEIPDLKHRLRFFAYSNSDFNISYLNPNAQIFSLSDVGKILANEYNGKNKQEGHSALGYVLAFIIGIVAIIFSSISFFEGDSAVTTGLWFSPILLCVLLIFLTYKAQKDKTRKLKQLLAK